MTNGIPAIRTLRQLRAQVAAWRAAGETIALVPTMGALHEGHLALVRLGRQRCRRVVVSIFVNPTQFAPHEDFERYPRDEAGDLAKLAGVGCDAAWMPDRGLMYPDGFATRIVPAGAAAVGASADGLALSSRNAYLTPEQRRIAPRVSTARSPRVAAAVRTGAAPAEAAAQARDDIARAGFAPVDYVEVRDADTLAPATAGGGRSLRVLAAAWLGKTRLIDNVAV